jgi:hypothetical protein
MTSPLKILAAVEFEFSIEAGVRAAPTAPISNSLSFPVKKSSGILYYLLLDTIGGNFN